MIQQELNSQIDRVARRISCDRFLQRCAVACLLAAIVAAGVWAVWTNMEVAWLGQISAALFVSCVLLTLLAVILLCGRRGKKPGFFKKPGFWITDRCAATRLIEKQFPDLDQRLLAAIEQQPSVETGRLSFLQNQVISEALSHAKWNDWRQVVPAARLARSAGLQLIGIGLFAVAFSALWLRPPVAADEHRASLAGEPMAGSDVDSYGIEVEPGDTEIERGTDLLVLASFNGQLPSDTTLVTTSAAGKPRRIALTKSLGDPLFGGRITAVERETSYHVEYDDRRTQDYRVTVFDFPQLEQLDAVIRLPDYTGMPELTIEDTRRIGVVEGSQIKLIVRVNKPIASAQLIDENESTLDLQPTSEQHDLFELTVAPRHNQRYTLHLIDQHGRHNKFPPELIIEITPNRRPDLKLTFPAKDLRVSPLEEVSLEALVWDDFGVEQYGLIYALAGQKPATLVIGDSLAGREHRDVVHLLSFENLQVEPDQLLAYYFFADDYGPDGRIRRSYSDMYFAEVRHFEEIFRQGQQPPGGAAKQQGGGGPQAQKLEELAKLQKRIVNAIWNVFRRETAIEPSETFVSDVKSIGESQQSALNQLHKLAEKLNNAKSQAVVTTVAEQMTATLDSLKLATADNETTPLSPALASAQSAYQGLLKLRAREHKIAQSKSGGGGGGGGSSRSQQQLDQLELSSKQHRYQTGRKAENRQSSSHREQLRVLNRLRDLARRQQGMNEKLKELDNALREAKSATEQAEIRRRLKRLRDLQQEMLRNIDELRNRMDRPENQRRMADDLRRLDRTRRQVLQASDALRRGRVSKALNAGTRAARELKNLQDDFRKRTAGQFADEMKNLRDRSRKLVDRQSELSDRLNSLNNANRRSLRDSRERKQIARGLGAQKQHLDDLLDRVKDVIRKAEQSEPLLSRKLYDTVRKARADQPGKNLEKTSRLLDKGLTKEAEDVAQRASRGIETVRKGIERAAESVLGSETESLRRAQRELDDLKQALENELAQSSTQRQSSRGNKPTQTASRPQPSGKNENPQKSSGASQTSGGTGGLSARGDRSTDAAKQSALADKPPVAPGGSRSPTGVSSRAASTRGSSKGASPSSGQSVGSKARGSQSSGGKSQRCTPGLRGGQQGGLAGGPGSHDGKLGPLTGDNFREWSDRMRDVEEMVEDPKLRDDVARIRDRARSMRVEFKRHSKKPTWDLVRSTIIQPLAELQRRLAEEIAQRESPNALVPIDREPVPDRFSNLVEKYYQRLGEGK